TPSCSTMMSFTFSSIDLSAIKFAWVERKAYPTRQPIASKRIGSFASVIPGGIEESLSANNERCVDFARHDKAAPLRYKNKHGFRERFGRSGRSQIAAGMGQGTGAAGISRVRRRHGGTTTPPRPRSVSPA